MTALAHAVWIRAYEERLGGPAATMGHCEHAAHQMAESFPELRVVRGHVLCPAPWGKRGHWWCVDADGQIVDPTRGQFPFADEQLVYEEYVDGDPVRLGVCMDCGAAIWGRPDDESIDTSFCDARCRDSYAAYLNSGDL